MELSTMAPLSCPYCGETFDVLIDRSEGKTQSWEMDCEVCCQPIRVSVRWRKKGPLIDTEQL